MTSTENSQPSSSSSSVSSKNNDIEKKSSARSSDKTEEQDTLLSSSTTTTTTNNLAPPVNTVIASVPAVKARVVKASSKLSTTTTNNNVVVAKATAICQSLNHDEGTQKKYQDTNNIQESSSDSRENSHTTTKTSTPTRSKKFLSSSGISRILFSPFSSSSNNTDQSEAIINNSAYNDFGDNEEDDQSIISSMSEESSTSSSSTSYLISRGRDRRTNKTSSKKKNKKSQSERKRLDKLIQIKKQNLENSSQILMNRLFNFLSTLDPVEDFYNNDGDVEGESSRNANHSTTNNVNVNVNVNSKNGITLPASSIAWLAYHLYPEYSKKEDDKEESTSSIDVNKLSLIKYMLRNITHLRVNSSQWPPPEDFSSPPSSSNYDEKTKLSQNEIHKLKKINENEDSLLLYSYETYDDDGEQKTEDQGGGNNGNDNDIQVNENQQQNGGKLFSFGVGIVDKLSGKKSQNDEFDDNNSITSANSYSTTASSYLFHQYSKVENKTTFSQEQLQKQEKQHLFQPQEHRLFLKEWHEIKYFPRIDLRLFPNLAVLLLDGVTPESLSHVFCNNSNNDDVQLKEKKTRGLTLFSLERGAIFNLSEFLSNQQEQQQESLLQTQNNNKQNNGSKNNCDNASNGLFTHNYEAKEVIQAKTATKKAKLDSMLDNFLDPDECVSSENNGYHHDEAEEKVDSALSNIQNSNDEITDTPVTTNPHNTTRISSLLLSPIHEDKEEIEIETKTGMIINPSIINRKSDDHARQNHKINNPNKNEALTIKKFPDLTHLKLSQCALSEFSFMPPSNNVSYSMSNTYNNDSPKKSIQLFSRFPNLRTLILSKNQILYSTTILNTGLPPTLTTLDLSYNFLSEFSPKANLFLGGQLRNLILSHNRITSISRKTCGIHKLYSLEKLCLDGNNLSDLTSDVSALTSLPMLSHLQLMGNSFSQDLEEEEYRLQTLTLFYNNKTRSSRDIDSIDLPVLDNIPVTTQELEQLELMLDFDLSLNVNDIVSKSSPAHHKEKQKTHRHHHKVTVNINNQLMEEWEQVCQGMMHDEETKDNYNTERNVVDDEEDFFCSIGLLSTLIQAKKARGKRKKKKKKKKLAPVSNNIKKMNYSDHEMLLLDTLSSSQVYPHLIKMKKDNDSHHCQHHHGEENRGRKPGNSQISNKSSSNFPLSSELFEPFLTRIQAIEENIEHDALYYNDEELYLQQQASLANRFHRNKNKRMFIDRHDEQLAQTVNAPFTTKMRNNKTEENIAFLQELFKNEFNDEYWFEEVLVEKEEPTNLTSDSQHHTNDTVVDTTSQEEKDLRRKMSELLSAPTEQDEEEGPDDIIPQNLREMRVLDNLELYFHLYIFPSLQGGSGEEEEDEENDEAELLEDFPDGDNNLLMDFPSNDEESENESSIIQKNDGVENRNTDGSTTSLHHKKKKKKKKKRLTPRIQLFPSDSFSVVSLSTGSSSPTENNVGTKEEKEQFIKLWNLSILPIGIYSFTRITPLIIKLRGFQGEAIVEKGKRKGGEKKEKFTKVADSQPCILCLSDKAIYFIKVFNEKGNSKEKRSSTRTSAIGSNQRGSLGRVGESGSSSIAGDNRSVFTSLSGNNNRQDDDTTSVYSFESSAAYSMFTRGGGGGPGTVMTTNSGGTLFSAIEETDNNNTGTSRVYPSPIPANAIFKEGHWPHAWARYSLSHLQKIVIGFGFQRLSLHFLNPGKTRNSKSYVYVIQCDKSTSVSIIQSIQSNLSTLDSQHHANISHNLIIENDDALFLDALNTAVSKNRNESSPNNNSKIGTILHYQILKQKWRKEFRESVERVIVLSDEHLFLLQEGYVGDGSKILTKKMMMKMSDGFITSTSGEEKSSQVNKKRIGDVTLSCIDSAPLYKVTQISVEDNKPNCVLITLQMKDDDTAAAAAAMGAANKAKTNNSEGLSSSPPLRGGSFRRSGLLKMLSFTNRNLRYWRLICRDREGAEKLVKDVRNAMSIMF